MRVPSPGQEDPLEEGNVLQYSCLENPMDRGAWWVIVHGVAKNHTQVTEHPCTHRSGKCINGFNHHNTPFKSYPLFILKTTQIYYSSVR